MKKSLYLLLSLLLVCSIYQACAPEELPGSIYGTVVDKATGEPIKSAGVELSPSGLKTVTGSEGQFEFTELDPGKYTLLVTKTGYIDSVSHSIEVKPGQQTKSDIQIEKLPPSLRVVNDKKEDIDTLDFGSAEDDVVRSFSIFNDGEYSLEWEVTYTADWIKNVSLKSGVLAAGLTQPLVLMIDRKKLTEGNNTTTFYIISNNGSKQLTIVAFGESMPIVNTNEATDITATSATLNGKIINVGSPIYDERGFVYSVTSSSNIDSTWTFLKSSFSDNDDFTYDLEGLSANTLYYVRAYATNKAGTNYGGIVSFKTLGVLAEVKTEEASNVTSSSATLKANVLEKGEPAYTERGFCYAKSSQPTIENNKIKVDGNGVGEYQTDITNLDFNTTYYVRSYLIQSGETRYGNEISLQTKYIPTSIITSGINDVGMSSAVLNGVIKTKGDPTYSERGFCYGTMTTPTINNTKVVDNVSGIEGSYSIQINNLSYDTKYYVRAYAIQNTQVIYGNVESFSTVWNNTKVSTSEANNINITSAILNGTIESAGIPVFSEKGFCYSTNSHPTVYDKKVVVAGISEGSYTTRIVDLEYKTKYYVRAYAIQNGDVIYGNEINFTTKWESATILTYDAYPEWGKITFTGYINEIGNPPCSESGFAICAMDRDVWVNSGMTYDDLRPNKFYPYTYNVSEGAYAAVYNVNENAVLAFQAYAVQGNDTIKGEVKYILPHSRPIIQTEDPMNITSSSMDFMGNVIWPGNPPYTERGIVVSTTNTSPIVDGFDCDYAFGEYGGSGRYRWSVTDLSANTTYYIRAYVINSYGTFYGNTIVATTLP